MFWICWALVFSGESWGFSWSLEVSLGASEEEKNIFFPQQYFFSFVIKNHVFLHILEYGKFALKNPACRVELVLPSSWLWKTCGRNFKNILRKRLSLTWGWPEVLCMAPQIVNKVGLTWALLSVHLACISSESQWVRGSFLLTNSSLCCNT